MYLIPRVICCYVLSVININMDMPREICHSIFVTQNCEWLIQYLLYLFGHVKKPDTPVGLSAFMYKGYRIPYFLFDFLDTKCHLKSGLLKKERICSQEEQLGFF